MSQSNGRRKRSSRSSRSQLLNKTSTGTTSTRSTGPYDRAFQQHLVDHDILPDEYEYLDGRVPPAPGNMDEILQALSRDRASLSPSRFSNDDFRKFKRANTQASKEIDVTVGVVPIIEGDVGDRKCSSGQIPFSNLDDLTDGTLVPGNPDRYYGARPEQLRRDIRADLNGLVVPSTQHDLPIAPNFFLQVKGPDGTPAVATRQACYDGALGARGMHSLQSYKAPGPIFDNQAYTLTSIYQDGQLKIYTSHPIQPMTADGSPGYAMTQVKTFSLTGDDAAFRAGAAAYRNGRDWAKLQRDDAIKRAHAAADKSGADTSSATQPSEKSAGDGDTAESSQQTSDSTEDSVATEEYEAERPAKRRSPEKQTRDKPEP